MIRVLKKSAYIFGVLPGNQKLKESFLDAVKKSNMTNIGYSDYIFKNGGYTGVVLLAESHAAIHTWPEEGFLWIEIATCGEERGVEDFFESVGSWPWVKKVEFDG
tara:strand:- start:388 stop:702 length:315 start_codon:yes stop_codon:yes gene_type:complete